MRTWGLAFVGALALTGCNSDPDGDGLDGPTERDLGTSPKEADSDGDGLDDGAEVDAGTNAVKGDSDGDGLSDGDEVLYGFDPLDEKSDGYRGKWPMQEVAIKDAIASNGRSGQQADIGKRWPRYHLKDQFNDEVDLYDFAGHGKKVVIDISAQWCPPCNDISAWLDGAENPNLDEGIREAVLNGDVYWVTILAEDYQGNPAVLSTVKEWHDLYPTQGIPVLADTPYESVDYGVASGWPTLYLLNENMTVIAIDTGYPLTNMAAKIAE